MTKFSAETAENDRSVEIQWAVTAMDHAETYMNLIKAVDTTSLRLTSLDDEIYNHFTETFPDFNIENIDVEMLKSAEAKEKWRPWMMTYEKKVDKFNFGTLLRINANEDYTEENSIFATRIQFYAIEIARNRKGLNKFSK